MVGLPPREITLFFHSDKEDDNKTRSYVENIEGFVVKMVDVKKERLTEEDLAEIADKLDEAIEDLFDRNYVDRLNIGSLKGISEQDAFRLLAGNPVLLATPILIIGDHAFQFESTLQQRDT
jgi:arsenate reductase-like glutaredoxin family protein